MENDYNNWNILKQKINLGKNDFFSRAGEVCLCILGLNVGFESNGKNQNFIRPVLVIRSYRKSGAIVLPLTSKQREDLFHFKLNECSFVKLTQIKFVDSKRFKRCLYKIDRNLLKEIRTRLFRVI